MVLGSIKTEDIFKELIYRGEHGEKLDPCVIQRLMTFIVTKHKDDDITKEDDDITKRVKKVIGCVMNIDKEIQLKDRLVEDFGMDSLDEIEIIIHLENEFGVKIPDEEIMEWGFNKTVEGKTVEDVIDAMKDKLKQYEDNSRL